MVHPRSTAFIGWLALSFRVRLLRLLGLLRRLLGLQIVDGLVDCFRQCAHARRVGAEVVPAIARRRADIDARAVGIRAYTHHDIVAKAEDRRSRYRLDAAVTAPGLRA